MPKKLPVADFLADEKQISAKAMPRKGNSANIALNSYNLYIQMHSSEYIKLTPAYLFQQATI